MGSAFLPRGAPAKDAGEAGAGFRRELERTGELGDADAGAEVDIGDAGGLVGGAIPRQGLGAVSIGRARHHG
jgi:hypothetical protein